MATHSHDTLEHYDEGDAHQRKNHLCSARSDGSIYNVDISGFPLLQATLRAKMKFIERDVDGFTSEKNVTESGNIQKRQKERSLFCAI